MAKGRGGLGRGLESLFEDAAPSFESDTRIETLPLREIEPDPGQPRKTFDDETLAELSASIAEHGLLQPIAVRPRASGGYLIVAGERRWRASRMAGLTEVPVIVKDVTDEQAMELALVENLQREDLDPVEEAAGIRELMDRCGLTQEQAARKLGKSRSALANILRLLTLPEDIITMVRQGTLSAGHARVLAGLESDEMKMTLARQTITNEWSVRQLENAVALMRKSTPTLPKTPQKVHSLPAELTELETFCRETFGVRATITGNQKKGKITLQYYSAEELEQVYELLHQLHHD